MFVTFWRRSITLLQGLIIVSKTMLPKKLTTQTRLSLSPFVVMTLWQLSEIISLSLIRYETKSYLLSSFRWLVKHLIEKNLSCWIRPYHIQALDDAFFMKLDLFVKVFWRRKMVLKVILLPFMSQLTSEDLFDRWLNWSSIVWPRHFSLLRIIKLQICVSLG